MTELKGYGVSQGVVQGELYYYNRTKPAIEASKITDTTAELARLEVARTQAMEELEALGQAALEKVGEAEAEIFEIHKMMLDDLDYVEAIQEKINQEHYCAEYAVQATGEEFAAMFASMEDNEYMQARATDVADISGRVVGILTGQTGGLTLTRPVIVVTDDLTPSETVAADRSMILALVTSGGSANSHTAILSRTMGIPAIVSTQGVDENLTGKIAIVDGTAGTVLVDPDEAAISAFQTAYAAQQGEQAELETYRGLENVTQDGHKVKLFANIGSPADVEAVLAGDAGGVGLFRSEFLFLGRSDYPDEETQFQAYKEVLEGLKGKEVVIRTLDIGADKQVDYFELPHEENPALGFRATRICLARPELFKTQLRALLRASVYGTLLVMFPMIISKSEVDDIKVIIAEAKAELEVKGQAYDENVKWGIMIETPAAAILSDVLAQEVDFFSIGTNDLTQYTLAADRQNLAVASSVDPHHPAVLRLIQMTVENSHKHGIWTGICGELAADESLTETFLKMGVDELSMSPKKILSLRRHLRGLTVGE